MVGEFGSLINQFFEGIITIVTRKSNSNKAIEECKSQIELKNQKIKERQKFKKLEKVYIKNQELRKIEQKQLGIERRLDELIYNRMHVRRGEATVFVEVDSELMKAFERKFGKEFSNETIDKEAKKLEEWLYGIKKGKRKGFPSSVKRSVLLKQKNLCKKCYRFSQTWDFDHIDDDPSNNDASNCQALCPTCHAKKTRGIQD